MASRLATAAVMGLVVCLPACGEGAGPPASDRPANRPTEPASPPVVHPPAGEELRIVGRVLRATEAPACGYRHAAAAFEYEVERVEAGDLAPRLIVALQSCPRDKGLGVGQRHRVVLERSAPTGLDILDDLGAPTEHRWWAARTEIVLVGASPGGSSEPEPSSASEGATPACPGPLPRSMPLDLVVGRSQVVLPRGKSPQRYGVELTADPRRCEHATCVTVPVADMQRLWAAFHRHDFATMEARPQRRSPHVGSIRLWLRFGDTRCELGDDSQRAVDRSDAFHDLAREASQLGRAHAAASASSP